jgi:hypothetical protein
MSPHGVKPATPTDERMKPSAMSRIRPVPGPGDVLASRRSARADIYEISVVPAEAHTIVGRYPEAVARVRELARQLRADGWYTTDHTHYARIAACRAEGDVEAAT